MSFWTSALEVIALALNLYAFICAEFLPSCSDMSMSVSKFVRDAGIELDARGDLNTRGERKLGQLVLEKY